MSSSRTLVNIFLCSYFYDVRIGNDMSYIDLSPQQGFVKIDQNRTNKKEVWVLNYIVIYIL